jgi:hypothetical protein
MNEVQLADELRDTLAERALLYASDQGGYAQPDDLEKLANGDQWAISDAVQVLESRGLSRDDSMVPGVRPTPAGQRVAQRICVMRTGQWRFEDLQGAALTWLNRHADGAAPGLDRFLDAPEAVDFEPAVIMQELQDAIELLDESGHVKAVRVAEHGAVLAMITPKGRVALQSGLPISQQGGGSGQTTYDNRNTVNVRDSQVAAVMAGGHRNVQNVEQTIGPDLRSELAEHVVKLIQQAEELPDDTPGVLQVRDDLDEIGNELVKPDAKPGVLKGLASKALAAFAEAAATSGGQYLVQGLAHFVKLLEQVPS